ncbi:hypothetical protein M5D96_011132 [Drosophila gunungcola]|uniref:Uncharacterized protein n=1 Tax=Drosophila gunungcola TaxID=103775 RepID=A0A9P9YG97_9MUSC|nr:hypothetical protein M5D96_011132 [Drosophila gunungcola]
MPMPEPTPIPVPVPIPMAMEVEVEEGAGKAGDGSPRGAEEGPPRPGSQAAVTVIPWTVVDICGARSWG